MERVTDPDDRRGRILTLSKEGRALCEDLQSQSLDERERVFEGFTEADLVALTDALDHLEANIRTLLKNDRLGNL